MYLVVKLILENQGIEEGMHIPTNSERLWEEVGISGGNPCMPGENTLHMEIPQA